MEALLRPLLQYYASEYLKNIRPEDLELSLWGGDLVLRNLELRQDAVKRDLDLPVDVVSGRVHEARVRIPWTSLTRDPVVVSLSLLEIVLAPEGASSRPKTATAAPLSSTAPAALAPATGSAEMGLLPMVLNNVRFEIHNVVVKYADGDAVVSLSCKSVVSASADAAWRPAVTGYVGAHRQRNRTLDISELTLCVDHSAADGRLVAFQDPLIYKYSFGVRICTADSDISLLETSASVAVAAGTDLGEGASSYLASTSTSASAGIPQEVSASSPIPLEAMRRAPKQPPETNNAAPASTSPYSVANSYRSIHVSLPELVISMSDMQHSLIFRALQALVARRSIIATSADTTASAATPHSEPPPSPSPESPPPLSWSAWLGSFAGADVPMPTPTPVALPPTATRLALLVTAPRVTLQLTRYRQVAMRRLRRIMCVPCIRVVLEDAAFASDTGGGDQQQRNQKQSAYAMVHHMAVEHGARVHVDENKVHFRPVFTAGASGCGSVRGALTGGWPCNVWAAVHRSATFDVTTWALIARSDESTGRRIDATVGAARLTLSKVFALTAVDFAGPHLPFYAALVAAVDKESLHLASDDAMLARLSELGDGARKMNIRLHGLDVVIPSCEPFEPTTTLFPALLARISSVSVSDELPLGMSGMERLPPWAPLLYDHYKINVHGAAVALGTMSWRGDVASLALLGDPFDAAVRYVDGRVTSFGGIMWAAAAPLGQAEVDVAECTMHASRAQIADMIRIVDGWSALNQTSSWHGTVNSDDGVNDEARCRIELTNLRVISKTHIVGTCLQVALGSARGSITNIASCAVCASRGELTFLRTPLSSSQQNKRENAFVFQRQRRTPRKRNNNDPLYLLALNDFMDVLVVSGAALEASFDPVVAAWLCEPEHGTDAAAVLVPHQSEPHDTATQSSAATKSDSGLSFSVDMRGPPQPPAAVLPLRSPPEPPRSLLAPHTLISIDACRLYLSPEHSHADSSQSAAVAPFPAAPPSSPRPARLAHCAHMLVRLPVVSVRPEHTVADLSNACETATLINMPCHFSQFPQYQRSRTFKAHFGVLEGLECAASLKPAPGYAPIHYLMSGDKHAAAASGLHRLPLLCVDRLDAQWGSARQSSSTLQGDAAPVVYGVGVRVGRVVAGVDIDAMNLLVAINAMIPSFTKREPVTTDVSHNPNTDIARDGGARAASITPASTELSVSAAQIAAYVYVPSGGVMTAYAARLHGVHCALAESATSRSLYLSCGSFGMSHAYAVEVASAAREALPFGGIAGRATSSSAAAAKDPWLIVEAELVRDAAAGLLKVSMTETELFLTVPLLVTLADVASRVALLQRPQRPQQLQQQDMRRHSVSDTRSHSTRQRRLRNSTQDKPLSRERFELHVTLAAARVFLLPSLSPSADGQDLVLMGSVALQCTLCKEEEEAAALMAVEQQQDLGGDAGGRTHTYEVVLTEATLRMAPLAAVVARLSSSVSQSSPASSDVPAAVWQAAAVSWIEISAAIVDPLDVSIVACFEEDARRTTVDVAGPPAGKAVAAAVFVHPAHFAFVQRSTHEWQRASRCVAITPSGSAMHATTKRSSQNAITATISLPQLRATLFDNAGHLCAQADIESIFVEVGSSGEAQGRSYGLVIDAARLTSGNQQVIFDAPRGAAPLLRSWFRQQSDGATLLSVAVGHNVDITADAQFVADVASFAMDIGDVSSLQQQHGIEQHQVQADTDIHDESPPQLIVDAQTKRIMLSVQSPDTSASVSIASFVIDQGGAHVFARGLEVVVGDEALLSAPPDIHAAILEDSIDVVVRLLHAKVTRSAQTNVERIWEQYTRAMSSKVGERRRLRSPAVIPVYEKLLTIADAAPLDQEGEYLVYQWRMPAAFIVHAVQVDSSARPRGAISRSLDSRADHFEAQPVIVVEALLHGSWRKVADVPADHALFQEHARFEWPSRLAARAWRVLVPTALAGRLNVSLVRGMSPVPLPAPRARSLSVAVHVAVLAVPELGATLTIDGVKWNAPSSFGDVTVVAVWDAALWLESPSSGSMQRCVHMKGAEVMTAANWLSCSLAGIDVAADALVLAPARARLLAWTRHEPPQPAFTLEILNETVLPLLVRIDNKPARSVDARASLSFASRSPVGKSLCVSADGGESWTDPFELFGGTARVWRDALQLRDGISLEQHGSSLRIAGNASIENETEMDLDISWVHLTDAAAVPLAAHSSVSSIARLDAQIPSLSVGLVGEALQSTSGGMISLGPSATVSVALQPSSARHRVRISAPVSATWSASSHISIRHGPEGQEMGMPSHVYLSPSEWMDTCIRVRPARNDESFWTPPCTWVAELLTRPPSADGPLYFICMAEGGLPVIVKCVVRTSASGETAALELSFDRGPMLINRCARLSVSVSAAVSIAPGKGAPIPLAAADSFTSAWTQSHSHTLSDAPLSLSCTWPDGDTLVSKPDICLSRVVLSKVPTVFLHNSAGGAPMEGLCCSQDGGDYVLTDMLSVTNEFGAPLNIAVGNGKADIVGQVAVQPNETCSVRLGGLLEENLYIAIERDAVDSWSDWSEGLPFDSSYSRPLVWSQGTWASCATAVVSKSEVDGAVTVIIQPVSRPLVKLINECDKALRVGWPAFDRLSFEVAAGSCLETPFMFEDDAPLRNRNYVTLLVAFVDAPDAEHEVDISMSAMCSIVAIGARQVKVAVIKDGEHGQRVIRIAPSTKDDRSLAVREHARPASTAVRVGSCRLLWMDDITQFTSGRPLIIAGFDSVEARLSTLSDGASSITATVRGAEIATGLDGCELPILLRDTSSQGFDVAVRRSADGHVRSVRLVPHALDISLDEPTVRLLVSRAAAASKSFFGDASTPTEPRPVHASLLELDCFYVSAADVRVSLSAASTTVAVSKLPLRLSEIDALQVVRTPGALLHSLSMAYMSDALVALPSVIGSLSALGSPASALPLVAAGLHDLFALPRANAARGPLGVASGVAQGVGSLLSHIAEAGLLSVDTFSKSVAGGLDALSGDAAFAASRRAARSERSQSAASSVWSGFRALGGAVVSGLAGVVKEPVRGMVEEPNIIMGGVQGMARGVLGAVVKPASGLLDFVRGTAQGVASVIGGGTQEGHVSALLGSAGHAQACAPLPMDESTVNATLLLPNVACVCIGKQWVDETAELLLVQGGMLVCLHGRPAIPVSFGDILDSRLIELDHGMAEVTVDVSSEHGAFGFRLEIEKARAIVWYLQGVF